MTNMLWLLEKLACAPIVLLDADGLTTANNTFSTWGATPSGGTKRKTSIGVEWGECWTLRTLHTKLQVRVSVNRNA